MQPPWDEGGLGLLTGVSFLLCFSFVFCFLFLFFVFVFFYRLSKGKKEMRWLKVPFRGGDYRTFFLVREEMRDRRANQEVKAHGVAQPC